MIAVLIFSASILTLVSIRKASVKTLSIVRLVQHPAFVHRDVVGLIALDLILWLIPAGAMHMPFIINILRVHLDNLAADVSGLRVPGHVIADFESLFHQGYPVTLPLDGSPYSGSTSPALR
jgi:hypothetical protein